MTALLEKLDIVGQDWHLDVAPLPSSGWGGWTLGGVRAWEAMFECQMTCERFGILPGSTLTLTEPN
jgi:hypothetical protein